METLFSPSVLVGFGMLVVLEVVLGIDNLVFIAILAGKLPPEQREKARRLGLGLALGMRLGLLALMSRLTQLREPIFSVRDHPFSGRDLILLVGGLFLLFKATMELHERLESVPHSTGQSRHYAAFWVVVTQIVVLDAVFSLDAVITAVGIMTQLPVMMAAVVVAMLLMLTASKPLTAFVNAHPTVVVLCLSFLLLIGLSLIAESMGVHLPKGYLYAAIGFSILIECFNQAALHNARKHERRRPMRLRTAEAVMRLLGGLPSQSALVPEAAPAGGEQATESVFASAEIGMVSRVLTLSERTARSIMTHRTDITFINLEAGPEAQRAALSTAGYSFLPVCRGGLDTLLGVGHSAALLDDLTRHGAIRKESLQKPVFVPESMRAVNLLEALRKAPANVVFVADEFGSIEGLITFMDFFEAIAGDLQPPGEEPTVAPLPEGGWRIAGAADVHMLESTLDIPDLAGDGNDYTTLAGFMLAGLGRLPEAGDSLVHHGWRFTVESLAERRIVFVLVQREEPGSGND